MKTWEILGIEATSEISAIKRAYAKKLKIYHPEDDPQGYQMLREAYDSALKFAKNNQNKEPVVTEQTIERNESIEEYEPQQVFIEKTDDTHEEDDFYPTPPVNIVEEVIATTENREQFVEEFFEKAAKIYNNFFDRLEEKKWQELLNDEIMWRFDCKELINDGMLQFLMKNLLLPKNIWHLLNRIFRWDEQESYLSTYYDETFVKYLFMKISRQRTPRYSYFDKNIQIEYDKYVYYREEAFMALRENDLKKAEEYISLAYKMYNKDPDLLCMKGDYYLKIKKNFKASSAFKNAKKINPNDKYIHFYQAEIMYNNKKYVKALKICKFHKVGLSKNLELRTLLGKCYFSIKRWKEASKLFKDNLKIDPTNNDIKKYLIEIAENYRLILKKHPLKFSVRKDLKSIYCALGQPQKIDEIKITSQDMFTIFKNFIFIIIGILVLIALVVLALEGGAPAAIGLLIFFFIIRFTQKRRSG
jgi:tetratricopeptide (TPR) repeat protein